MAHAPFAGSAAMPQASGAASAQVLPAHDRQAFISQLRQAEAGALQPRQALTAQVAHAAPATSQEVQAALPRSLLPPGLGVNRFPGWTVAINSYANAN